MKFQLKSLLVGTALACAISLSGHAGIVISYTTCEKLEEIIREILLDHQTYIQRLLEEIKPDDLKEYAYTDEDIEKDMDSICSTLCMNAFEIEVFNYCFDPFFEMSPIGEKSFVALLNETFNPLNDNWNRTIFFKRNALGVFLRFCMCDVCPNSHYNFAIEWNVFLHGRNCINLPFQALPGYQRYRRHIPNPFSLLERIRCLADDYYTSLKGSRYIPFSLKNLHYSCICNENKDTFERHWAEEIFSKKYIDKIEDILYQEIFQQLEDNNKKMLLCFIKEKCNEGLKQEVFRSFAVNLLRYKKIKRAFKRNMVCNATRQLYKDFLASRKRLIDRKTNKNVLLVSPI